MTDPQRQDFARIIAELEAAGVTLHTIAKMTRRQFIQVQRWKAGSEPRHHEGERLLAMHAEYVSRETAPIITPVS